MPRLGSHSRHQLKRQLWEGQPTRFRWLVHQDPGDSPSGPDVIGLDPVWKQEACLVRPLDKPPRSISLRRLNGECDALLANFAERIKPARTTCRFGRSEQFGRLRCRVPDHRHRFVCFHHVTFPFRLCRHRDGGRPAHHAHQTKKGSHRLEELPPLSNKSPSAVQLRPALCTRDALDRGAEYHAAPYCYENPRRASSIPQTPGEGMLRRIPRPLGRRMG